MIRVSIELREGAVTRRVRVTASSIERAVKMAGYGMTGRRVRLLFPIDPETYFASEDLGRRDAG